MRKIILDLAVSLDGFIEGANGETDWCIMDPEMNFDAFLADIDTIFYGRISYDTWGNFIPEVHTGTSEMKFWKEIHSKKKYVFSSQHRQDERAQFIGTDIEKEITEIKSRQGKDIWLYGGASLIKTFICLDLIDEYRISVHPVVLGSGKPLFENVKERINLSLIKTNTFNSGVVQLIYVPQKSRYSET